ncbi:MAG: ABC transporter substrate-binding protein [Oscillospiraceae bacterium]
MKKKVLCLCLAALMLLGLLSGCGGQSATSEHPGVFNIAVNSIPDSLQPNNMDDDKLSVVRPVYEPLFAETKDGYEYYLADKVELSEDGLTYTIHINDNANWSDGEPVVVQDILFSMEYEGLAYGGYSAYNIVNNEPVTFNVVDDKTLEITLPQVYDVYSQTLSLFYPMPSHAFNDDPSAVDNSGYFSSPDMVTSGAYTVSEINADSIVFTAREDYYRGTPQVQQVVMKTIGAGTTTQLAFENGEIDCMRVTTAEDLAKYEAASDQYNLFIIPEARLNYLQINPKAAVLSTLSDDARKAVFLALNAAEIVDIAYGSDQLAVPANSLLTPEQSLYNPDCAGYTQDLEEAQRLADASGLTGQTLTYIYNSDRANMEEIATVIQQQLGAIGVNVNIEGLDSMSFFMRFYDFGDEATASSWDLATNGWDSERGTHPGKAFNFMTNRNFYVNTGFSTELVDMIKAATANPNAEEKQAAWLQIQDLALEEYREYPLTYTNYVIVSHKYVSGLDGSSVIPEFIDYLSIEVK